MNNPMPVIAVINRKTSELLGFLLGEDGPVGREMTKNVRLAKRATLESYEYVKRCNSIDKAWLLQVWTVDIY